MKNFNKIIGVDEIFRDYVSYDELYRKMHSVHPEWSNSELQSCIKYLIEAYSATSSEQKYYDFNNKKVITKEHYCINTNFIAGMRNEMEIIQGKKQNFAILTKKVS